MGILKKNLLELIKRTSLSSRGIAFLILHALYIVHGVLTVVFMCARVPQLVISNLTAILLYTFVYLNCVKRGRYICYTWILFFIIQIHSVFAYIMLGWDYGFSLYCIIIMPLAVFAFYLFEKENIHIKKIMFADFVVLACVLGSRVWVYKHGAFVVRNRNWAVGVSTFNMYVCGTITILLCSMFIYQRVYTDNKLKKQTERLDFMANYDSLTMLRNRRNLRSVLLKEMYQRKEKTNTKPMCIALGDIDDFKKINDKYGHDCGDMVLVKLGSIFIDKIKDLGYAGRWGGEEMLFMFPMLLEDSKALVSDITKEINEYVFTYNDEKFKVSMTFGITEYAEGVTLDEMLIKADMLMYQGKSAGKNQIVI